MRTIQDLINELQLIPDKTKKVALRVKGNGCQTAQLEEISILNWINGDTDLYGELSSEDLDRLVGKNK